MYIFGFVMALLVSFVAGQSEYQVGVGIGDCTGPAAEVNMMGYARPEQKSAGIHQRQFCRAFLIGDSSKRVAFVSVDAGMISQLLKMEVVKELQSKYGSIYSDENVCLSGTHTHSGPAGFHQYVLFEVTSLGFVKETFDALVDGIVKSIVMAHNSMAPGRVKINEGELLDSNINRSPTAYLQNPSQERKNYQHDTDKEMVLLRLEDRNGNPIGTFNWFAVHGTSMNPENLLISGDNKGYASYLFEKQMEPDSMPGKGKFVAAFASTNLGDVSPNTRGPHCTDTGLPCDVATSTCGGKAEKCIATGPGKDMFESTEIIGRNQFNKAKQLFDSATTILSGPVDHRLKYIDMTELEVTLKDGSKVRTCKPAMGFSFAAGTTDGPGAFSFTQNDTSGNEFWKIIRDVIKKPSQELTACHHPKPILLATGEMRLPYMWQADIVDVQILRIGQLAILGVPGEFTTMSGRRLRNKVAQVLKANGLPSDTKVVIAGLSNTYSDYIATYEEYQIQRYEGASTIYGPHTLEAYLQEFSKISEALAKGEPVDKGTSPPNLRHRQITLQTGVVYDTVPPFKNFGDVVKQVKSEYNPGDKVEVSFRSGHPKNDVMHGDTFLTVEQKQSDGNWNSIATDGSWETRFKWKRTNAVLGQSKVTVEWDIPAATPTGTYRIRHFGHYKAFWGGKIKPYTGTSDTFMIHRNQIQKNDDNDGGFLALLRRIGRATNPMNLFK